MIHTECKDCKLREGDCGYHFKMNGEIDFDIPSLSACDRYGNCGFFKRDDNMDDKKALKLLKSMHRRDFLCSECQKDDEQCKASCEYGQALFHAIKALEDSSHIIEALEKLKDDTLDGLVSFGVEKSIDCIKNMRRKQHDKS